LNEKNLLSSQKDSWNLHEHESCLFKRSWINTGLVKRDEFDEDIEDVEEYNVVDFLKSHLLWWAEWRQS